MTLSDDERETLRQDVARAIPHAERHAEGCAEDGREHDAVRSLREIHARFPGALPRADLVRFRRSAKRLRTFEALKGPAFALGNEADLLRGVIEAALAPIDVADVEFDPEQGFDVTLIRGLEACVLLEPGAAMSLGLGLGTSSALPALLGIADRDLRQLYEEWLADADGAHPLARYPYVPHGRFSRVDAERKVRSDLDSTGPVGWAAAKDAETLAREFLALAKKHPSSAPALQAVSSRIDAVTRAGHAVVGLLEYLPAEAEGTRQWLAESEADSG